MAFHVRFNQSWSSLEQLERLHESAVALLDRAIIRVDRTVVQTNRAT